MKIGLIARTGSSGLGTLSWEFANHLKPHKVLMLENGVFQPFPERYKAFNSRLTKLDGFTWENIEWLTTDVDVILTMETFYDDRVVTVARQKGIKTALVTMCEMMEEKMMIKPDLFICPSTLDYQMIPEPKVYLPIPFNTDKLVWKERKEAKVFVHAASHGGVNGRKGTALLLEATRYIKKPVKIIINTWQTIINSDPRVEIRLVNYKNYWQCWREGDVNIHLQNYNGICLPISESFCSGMALLTTNIYPFNEWIPKECLFEPSGFYKTRISAGRMEVDAATIDPRVVAAKIDEMAFTDISDISKQGKVYAEQNSWHALLPKYLNVLEDLCKK